MDPLITGAALSAIGSLASGMLSNSAASGMQERSIAAQRSLQNLLLNSGGMQARSAKQAGLSPAFALGNSSVPTASAVSASSHPYPNIDISSALSALSRSKLEKAQQAREEVQLESDKTQVETAKETKRLVAAQADQAEIEAERMSQHDDQFKWTTTSTAGIDPNTGEPIEDLDKWAQDHPGELPEIGSVTERSSYGAFLAQKEKEDRNLQLDDIRIKYLKNDIERHVYNEQLKDDDIINAIAQLPKYQLDEVKKNIDNLNSAINQRNYQNAVFEADKILRYVEADKAYTEKQLKEVEKGSEEWKLLNEKLGNTNRMLRDVYYAKTAKERAARLASYFAAKGDGLLNALSGAAGAAAGAYGGARLARPSSVTVKGFGR